ncbi:hypothetical protein Pelo_2728 [Pelomyxa schiedti]|nr:hypothetical protein Pelo_2728 [Pelomyxa schiedti]
MDESTSVKITNLNGAVTSQEVVDFVSYCGEIKSVSIGSNLEAADGTQEAIVTFARPESCKTALILTNTYIHDRPIVVSLCSTPNSTVPSHHEAVSPSQISQKTACAPEKSRSSTSVVASVIVGGYSIGTELLQSAKDYDDRHQVIAQLDAAKNVVLTKATKLDTQYLNLGDKMKQLGQTVGTYDAQYGITQTAATTFNSAKKTFWDTAAYAKEQAVSWLQQAYEPVTQTRVVGPGVAAVVQAGHSLTKAVGEVQKEAFSGIAEVSKRRNAPSVEDLVGPQSSQPGSSSSSSPTTTATTSGTTAASKHNHPHQEAVLPVVLPELPDNILVVAPATLTTPGIDMQPILIVQPPQMSLPHPPPPPPPPPPESTPISSTATTLMTSPTTPTQLPFTSDSTHANAPASSTFAPVDSLSLLPGVPDFPPPPYLAPPPYEAVVGSLSSSHL